MSELNNKNVNSNVNSKKTVKKTFIGLLIFTIICVSITFLCIYLTLIQNKQLPKVAIAEQNINNFENTSFENNEFIKTDDSYIPLKLTDKAKMNNIEIIKKTESYGDIISYYEYDNKVQKKLEIEYFEINGLKNKEIQDKINSKIENTINKLKNEMISKLDDESIKNMKIFAYVSANFSDVLSVYINEYSIREGDMIENIYGEDKAYGLNFSLETGEELKFEDLFWDNSPIKNILSKSVYNDYAWDFAFENEDGEWDMNMDRIDYSVLEKKVFNFLAKYNKNEFVSFYFSPTNIRVSVDGTETEDYISIKMEDFYKYIAIYSKYKSSENLYEEENNEKFYVFSESGINMINDNNGFKADNVYCNIYTVSNNIDDDLEKQKVEKQVVLEIKNKIDELTKTLKQNKDKGYILDCMYYINKSGENELNTKYGYNFEIYISECSEDYLKNNFEEIIAKGAREPRVEAAPIYYKYIDDNFEIYGVYSVYTDNYRDDTNKEIYEEFVSE